MSILRMVLGIIPRQDGEVDFANQPAYIRERLESNCCQIHPRESRATVPCPGWYTAKNVEKTRLSTKTRDLSAATSAAI